MSLFDPFSLYVHRQVNTKRGQVIQKKPYLNENQAISPEQIQNSINILHSIGVATIPLPYFNNILERAVAQRFEATSLNAGNNFITINQIINYHTDYLHDISTIPIKDIDYMRLQLLITEIYIAHTDTDTLHLVIEAPNFNKTIDSDVRAVGIISTSAHRNHYIGRKDDLTPIFDTIVKNPDNEFVSGMSIVDKQQIKDILDGRTVVNFINFENNSGGVEMSCK